MRERLHDPALQARIRALRSAEQVAYDDGNRFENGMAGSGLSTFARFIRAVWRGIPGRRNVLPFTPWRCSMPSPNTSPPKIRLGGIGDAGRRRITIGIRPKFTQSGSKYRWKVWRDGYEAGWRFARTRTVRLPVWDSLVFFRIRRWVDGWR